MTAREHSPHVDGCLETGCTRPGGKRLLCEVHARMYDGEIPFSDDVDPADPERMKDA